MKHISLITSGVLLHLSVLLTAQDTGVPNSITLEAGAGYIQRQDLVFSPMIHNVFTAVNAGLNYTREADLFQSIGLGFASYDPMVTDPYTFTLYGEERIAVPHLFTLVELDYLLGKSIRGKERSDLVLGGMFTSDIQALNYVFGRIGHFGYYAALGAGVFARYGLRLGEGGKLTSTVRIPLASLLARSPYLVNDDTFIENQASHSGVRTFFAFLGDGEVATWNSLQYFDLDLAYTHRIGSRWDLGIKYGFGFIRSIHPRFLLSFQNAVRIAGTFKF